MKNTRKISVFGVLAKGFLVGIKNIVSIFIASIFWLITIWIPYVNVGTTIAMLMVPMEMAKGNIVSPLFIFNKRYRQYMGEFFILVGLMSLSIIPAFIFMIVPGIIIAIGWSLSLYIMIDKEISPEKAMVESNKATYGYKWKIFFIEIIMQILLLVTIVLFVLAITSDEYNAFVSIPFVIVIIFFNTIKSGCESVIYHNLTRENIEQSVVKE